VAAASSKKKNLVLNDVEILVENWACDRVLFEARNIYEWRNWHKNGMQGQEPTRQNVLIIELMRSITERRCVTRPTHMATKDPKIIAFNLLRCDDDHTGSRAQATVNSLTYANSLRPDFWKDKNQPELANKKSGLFNVCLGEETNKTRSDLLIADPSQMSGLLAFIMRPPVDKFKEYLQGEISIGRDMNEYFLNTVEQMQNMSSRRGDNTKWICNVLVHPEMSSFRDELLGKLRKAGEGKQTLIQIVNAWVKENELNAPTDDLKQNLSRNIESAFKRNKHDLRKANLSGNVNGLLINLGLPPN